MNRIAILGGGSWGTALAILLSRSRESHQFSLWVHDTNLARAMREKRENATYLAGQTLPPAVSVVSEIGEAVRGASTIVGAMPSAHARAIYAAAKTHLLAGVPLVSATKRLEPGTHARMSELIMQAPRLSDKNVAVPSGPSFAAEAVRGEPTAVVLACKQETRAHSLQEAFGGPTFRLYTNRDVIGVELAGAMKNVIAIAAGVCQGLGLGANPLAALITRGLA